jgi:hypothetical protein
MLCKSGSSRQATGPQKLWRVNELNAFSRSNAPVTDVSRKLFRLTVDVGQLVASARTVRLARFPHIGVIVFVDGPQCIRPKSD